MSWTPQTGIYMDPHYNLVYPKGATHLDGIDKETMEVIDEHWGQFPPQHPLINHIVGICFLFLWLINLFGNGSVCYIFLKVYNNIFPLYQNCDQIHKITYQCAKFKRQSHLM